MSYFRVMPEALLSQREELETAYGDLCGELSKLGGVIRRLGTMSGFDDTIEALRRVQRKGGEQQMKLRRSAAVLGTVAELYIAAERDNLDGGEPAPVRPAERDAAEYPAWTPREMVPHAESLFGTGVVIRQRD